MDLLEPAPESVDELLSKILASYTVGTLKKAEPATGGLMNENWFVDTDTGKYFLRRRSEIFPSSSIEFELNLVEHLSSQGFPTPKLIRTSEGALSAHVGGRTWELYEYITGEPFSADNPNQIRSAARLLSRFHKLAAGYQQRADGILFRKVDLGTIVGIIDQIKKEAANELKTSTLGTVLEPGVIALIESQEEILINGILPLSGSLLTIVHGDYQPSNVIFRGDEAVAVIDLGNAALSYRSYDVARGILSFSTLNPDYKDQRDIDPWIDLDRARAFFAAYQAEMPIGETEIKAMPALMRGAFLFAIGFYIKIEDDLIKKAAYLVNALRFMRWFDKAEDDLRNLLLSEARYLRNEDGPAGPSS